ncbi:helix-turn-helix domain-containing protein [Nocardia wallacei]|uniref:helix-turn-helix domain-containing protein n=1 Tax=Nocardia wallacei TaxID=480035 RepID=UPI00245561A2|nr:helix-turn-helix domain-containing protein [Nocardia wallacei]
MGEPRRSNRGPSAAAGNRAALLAAARTVLAERGFDAPLSAIARAAGVGQGSLYRHFPTRESLALAVFEDNIAAIETLAATPESTLEEVLAAVISQLAESIALIEIIDPMADDMRLGSLHGRLSAVFTAKLDTARATGAMRADATVDDLLLALSMYAALLSRTPAADRGSVGARAWDLLQRSLSGDA